MDKNLVLAEKPSVAKDIARVIGAGRKNNGYYEGNNYIVTWALGHLVTLADPDEYDKSYKAWKLEDLPMLPDKLKLVVIKESSAQYKIVKELMKRDEVKNIIIATDAGREGELVARWIISKAGVKKPIKRLWISSVTDNAIKDGFANLKDGKDYEPLFASAQARAEADWLVGINATRALTCKYNAQLSCGRVQTPTLAIIAKREEEIRNFTPEIFFGLQAAAGKVKLTWQNPKDKSTRSFDKQYVQYILNEIKGKDAEITEIKKTLKRIPSPALYDLTELQRDANKKYDFSAKETLSYMQSLYEKHKVLTYPRTDSRYISDDIVPTLKDRLVKCGTGAYSKAVSQILKKPIKSTKNFVDSSKVSDHHAIIPTEQYVNLADFSPGERKIYDLVIKRFLSVLFPDYEYEQTSVKAGIGSQVFTAKGNIVKSLGWKELYSGLMDSENEDDEQTDDIKEQTLPELEKGQQLKVTDISITEGKTRPPSPFNEATLLSAMENPAKYMQNASKDLIATIGETSGLGTVATRADIIEKLFKTFLIEKKGKDIFITSKGKQLLELVPDDLKSPVLTAKWEQQLSAIAKSKLNHKQFTDEMRTYASQTVKEIKSSDRKFRYDNITTEKCPECGKFLLVVNGKKGKMLICQDRTCGYHKSISQQTNARCPQCHKKLELKGEGEGRIFVCSCGFREKLSAFNQRKSSESSSASKRDVARQLQKINTENKQPLNTSLADALSKFKQK